MTLPILPKLSRIDGLPIIRSYPSPACKLENLRPPIIVPRQIQLVKYYPEPNRPLPYTGDRWRRRMEISFVSLHLEPAYVSCQYQTRSVNEPLNAYVKHAKNFDELRKQNMKRLFNNSSETTQHKSRSQTKSLSWQDDIFPLAKREMFTKMNNVWKTLAPLNFSLSAKVKYGHGAYALERENANKNAAFHRKEQSNFMRATLEPLKINCANPRFGVTQHIMHN